MEKGRGDNWNEKGRQSTMDRGGKGKNDRSERKRRSGEDQTHFRRGKKRVLPKKEKREQMGKHRQRTILKAKLGGTKGKSQGKGREFNLQSKNKDSEGRRK